MIRHVIAKNLIKADLDTEQHLRNLISFVSARVNYPDDDQNEKLGILDSDLRIVLHTDCWDIGQLDALLKLQDQIRSLGNR